MKRGVTLHAMLLDLSVSRKENQKQTKQKQQRSNFNYLIKLSYNRPILYV